LLGAIVIHDEAARDDVGKHLRAPQRGTIPARGYPSRPSNGECSAVINVEGADKRASMNTHQSAGHRQPNRHGAFQHQDHRDERLTIPVAMKLKGELHFESSDFRQRSHPTGTTLLPRSRFSSAGTRREARFRMKRCRDALPSRDAREGLTAKSGGDEAQSKPSHESVDCRQRFPAVDTTPSSTKTPKRSLARTARPRWQRLRQFRSRRTAPGCSNESSNSQAAAV
jgi:hypothetical protein